MSTTMSVVKVSNRRGHERSTREHQSVASSINVNMHRSRHKSAQIVEGFVRAGALHEQQHMHGCGDRHLRVCQSVHVLMRQFAEVVTWW